MTKTSNFSHSQLINGHQSFVEESYLQFLEEIREDLQDEHDNEHLSPDFQEEFRDVVFSKDLNKYSPLKFYWLNLIDKLVDTLALIEEELTEPNDLIGVFSESDLLGFIIKELERETDVEEIFEQILDLQEIQIISFFHLHISRADWQPNGPVSYRLITEIGESRGHLYLGNARLHYDISESENEEVVPVVGYFPGKKLLQIMNGENVLNIEVTESQKTIDSLHIFPGYPQNEIDFTHFSKIEKAVKFLKETTPDLFQLFQQYTQNIVPVYQDELVSFSMATLPSYSSINMSNRDFVDILDDLLHENGHHLLNAILEGEEEVLFEDDDKVFFSPWRRSLRPVRGLYHAVVTFYWAYRLFKELSVNKELEANFNTDEIQKIYWRFLEEAELIRTCKEDLEKAFQMGKVSEFGKKITDHILKEIEQDAEIEKEISSKLTDEAREKLQAQFDEVNKARLI